MIKNGREGKTVKITGIAAEYNPFHLGHAYQLKHLRESGRDGIVAVMSGNFVQRGECALMDKFSRAEAAVASGVNLVIALPVSYSVASAERFAEGCVGILAALGCVQNMCFGSECGDVGLLQKTADTCLSLTSEELRSAMNGGKSFMKARDELLRAKGLPGITQPNDILAVEYLKAIRKQNAPLGVHVLKRQGAFHETEEHTGFRGAESIRKILRENPDADLNGMVTPESMQLYCRQKERGEAPADMRHLERAILAFYRMADAGTLAGIQGMTEGLENRICAEAHHAVSLEDLVARVKSRRYAMSAVRRAVLCGFLGLHTPEGMPPYLQVLAFDRTGREILKIAKKTCLLPLIHTLNPVLASNEAASVWVRQECRAAELFALALPRAGHGYGEFFHRSFGEV